MANDNANGAAKDFARSTSRCQSPAAAARCARARWPYLDPDPNPIGAPRDAHNRKAAIQMGIDPQEDPPIKPGQPTEPPQEDPPGNPRPEAAAARCARARWPYLDPDPNPIGAPRDAHNRKAAIQMGIDPQEDPPIKPGQPTEPPQEDPPGNPRPEIPPPVQDPGEPSRPQELPGSMPDELPVRGPPAPQTPPTDSRTTDLPGSDPDMSLGSAVVTQM